MTIASLFVQLGFSVKNPGAINDAEKSLVKASHSATRAAVAIDAMNAALFLLLETSAKVGVALKEFQIRTGLNTDRLQAWQQQAAASNVSADELTDTVKRLQDARVAFQLGEPEAVGAWTLLGVDPRQDPFVVLERLRARLALFKDVGLARGIAARAGIGEGMFQMLRQPPGGTDPNLILNQLQIDALFRLKTAWNSFILAIGSAKTQLGAALAPAVTGLIKLLTALSSILASATKWLSGTGGAAKAARITLGLLAAAVVVLGVAITGLAGALSLAAAAGALLSLATTPLLIEMLPIIAVIGLIVVGLGALILVIQDFWSAVDGKRSLFDWNDGLILTIKNVERLAAAMTALLDAYKRLDAVRFLFEKKALDDVVIPLINKIAPGANRNVQVNQDVDIHVNGAQSPQATGNQVGGHLQKQLNEAYRQGASGRW